MREFPEYHAASAPLRLVAFVFAVVGGCAIALFLALAGDPAQRFLGPLPVVGVALLGAAVRRWRCARMRFRPTHAGLEIEPGGHRVDWGDVQALAGGVGWQSATASGVVPMLEDDASFMLGVSREVLERRGAVPGVPGSPVVFECTVPAVPPERRWVIGGLVAFLVYESAAAWSLQPALGVVFAGCSVSVLGVVALLMMGAARQVTVTLDREGAELAGGRFNPPVRFTWDELRAHPNARQGWVGPHAPPIREADQRWTYWYVYFSYLKG